MKNKKKLALGEDCTISDKSKKSDKIKIKIITATITLVSLTIILITITYSSSLQTTFSSQVQTYGTPFLFILALLLDLIPQIVSPIVILTAGVLAGINPYYAVIITIAGSSLGSIIGFHLGKKYICKAVNLLTAEKHIGKVTHLTNKYGKIIVPLAAISPLPYLPVLFGAMNFKKRNFVIYGLIPRAIGIIFYGYLASLI